MSVSFSEKLSSASASSLTRWRRSSWKSFSTTVCLNGALASYSVCRRWMFAGAKRSCAKCGIGSVDAALAPEPEAEETSEMSEETR